jgi:hypothetical protein
MRVTFTSEASSEDEAGVELAVRRAMPPPATISRAITDRGIRGERFINLNLHPPLSLRQRKDFYMELFTGL